MENQKPVKKVNKMEGFKLKRMFISFALSLLLMFSTITTSFAASTNSSSDMAFYKPLEEKITDIVEAIQGFFSGIVVPAYASTSTYNGERAVKYELFKKGSNIGYYYYGGNINWRNNNPGNLRSGEGSIGSNGGFAVFPDFQTGFNAMKKLVLYKYGKYTIEKMIYKYAPPDDNNDTEGYIKDVTRKTGLKGTAVINKLSSSQQKALIYAMIMHEGIKTGKVAFISN